MGTAFLFGNGGGTSSGVELNFKVVGGTTQPSSPSTNTIWVNTSTSVTSYVFSATQPTGASGKVWIKIGTSSSVAFNALKSNTINVYPVSVSQYVSSAWATKEAKIYQDGAWVQFSNAYLYIYKGSTSTNYSFKCNTSLKQLSTGYTADSSYVTKNTSNIKVETLSSGSYKFTNIFTTNTSGTFTKVDLSKYSKIRIKGTLSGATTDRGCVFRAITSFGTLCTDNNAKSVTLNDGTINKTIDISSITSSCYLGFTFYNEATTFTLTEMWLE